MLDWLSSHASKMLYSPGSAVNITLNSFSINTQVIIKNRALCLARYLAISPGKMAASSRFVTVSKDDFRVEMFFLFFEIITSVFILKQLFASAQ